MTNTPTQKPVLPEEITNLHTKEYMKKVINTYLATKYIDNLRPFNGGYATGLIYELEDGSFYQSQSTDPLVQFRKLEPSEAKGIFNEKL